MVLFCPFPLSLCPVSLKLGSLFAVLEEAFSMEQAKEAGGGERRVVWARVPHFAGREGR